MGFRTIGGTRFELVPTETDEGGSSGGCGCWILLLIVIVIWYLYF